MLKKYSFALLVAILLPFPSHAENKNISIQNSEPYMCTGEGKIDCASYKLPEGDCKNYSKLPIYNELRFFTPNAGCFMEPNDYKHTLPILSCDAKQLQIEGKLSSGKTISLVMKRKPSHHHIIKRYDKGDATVEGYPAYGVEGDPHGEFSEFTLIVDGKKISIPTKAYKNFFEPGGADGFGIKTDKNIIDCGVGIIESKDKKHFYIYMSGSNAAGSYAVKWVFDSSHFITYILDTASDDSSWASVDGIK